MSGTMSSAMQNPLLYAGLGMLGQSGPSRQPRSPFAGALQGMQMYGQQNYMNQQTLAMQQLMEQRKAEEERKRQQQAMMPQLMEAYLNPQTPEARSQALGGMIGLNPAMASPILAAGMKGTKATSLMQNLQAAGLEPGTQEYETQMLAALTSPRVSVNVGTQAEKEAGLAMALLQQAETDIQRYENISPTAARVAGMPGGPLVSSNQAVLLSAAEDRWTAQMVKLISGAAASDKERTAIKNAYFAPPFASQEVKAEYARARDEARQAGVVRSGPAWEHFKGVVEQSKTPKRISSDAEYEELPSGTLFIGPDGQTRRKP